MNIVSSALVKGAVIHSKGSPLSSRPSSPPSIMRPHKRGLTKAGYEAARQRTGETQTPLASQLLWGLFFHRIQTLADFFFPLLRTGKKCKQQEQFHSVATNLANAVHCCSFALFLFDFCIFWFRLFSRGENSDFSLLSVSSHINYLSHVEKNIRLCIQHFLPIA